VTTLVLVGDSIANGLGLRPDEPSYGAIVAESLGLDFVDLTGKAQVVSRSRQLVAAHAGEIAVAIVAHGITEAIPRPTARALRLMPPRWRRTGWMDPRPFHSRHWVKGLVNRVESAVRWRVKNLLMRVSGTRTLMSREDYAAAHDGLVEELQRRGATVVVLGAPDISARFFPGAAESERSYEAAPARAVDVPLVGRLDRWDDFYLDHFHPNAAGHRRIADELVAHLGTRRPQ
jgi:hypothetical protein